jgi:transposase
VERILDLPEAEQAAIAATHVRIGFDESEQLGVLPKQYYVIRIKRAKYAPIHAEVPDAENGMRIAPRPAQILPKAIAHSSLLAEVVTGKFVDGLPLYRQEKIFAREGIELSRQTMSGWIVQLATPLAPVMAALKQHLTQGPVLQIDETPVQVLDEPGRANTTKSYMWVYRGGPPGKPVLWFQYAPSRGGEVPVDFLFPDGGPPPEHRFYLQTDGYAGYHALAEKDGIQGHMGCWAHVRRKAVEAANSRTKTGAAHAFVALIGKLYEVERRIRGTTPEHRHAVRLEKSQPILDEIQAWLDDKASKVLPKGLLGEAIQYTRKQWPILVTFLQDGHLELDNNLAENAIRPFAVGRKAWLFSGSPRGAEASAMLYTLVETAKANGLEPRAYLHYLFETLPTVTTPDGIEACCRIGSRRTISKSRPRPCKPRTLGSPDAYDFRHLALERALSGATCRLYRNAVRFLYLHVLQWPAFDVPLVVPKRAQRIPELLTRARPSRVPSAPVAAIREVRCRYACHADPPPCGLPSPGGRQR